MLTAEPGVDLATLHAHELEIPCEAAGARKGNYAGFHRTDPHPADWAVLKSCGCTIHLCDEWYQRGTLNDGMIRGMFCLQCSESPIHYVHAIPIRGSQG